MAILRNWTTAAQIGSGTVFRRLDHASEGKNARMTAQSAGIAFNRIARDLSLPDLDPVRISSHSGRIGASHNLVEDGASDAAGMRDSGWKTHWMVGTFSRGAKATRGGNGPTPGRARCSTYAVERSGLRGRKMPNPTKALVAQA